MMVGSGIDSGEKAEGTKILCQFGRESGRDENSAVDSGEKAEGTKILLSIRELAIRECSRMVRNGTFFG